MLGGALPRLWPFVLVASVSGECEAPCRGTELGRITPAEVGEVGVTDLELPPGAEIHFYQDLRLERPTYEVTVTKVGPDGREIPAPGETPKPPPYPGKIVQLDRCYRWEIDISQAGATTHLSCEPLARGGACGSTTTRAGFDDRVDCRVDACELQLPEGGPTSVEARFDVLYDCGYDVTRHVLKVVQQQW